MVTADDYAVLIDPTCILRPTPLPLGRGDCYRGRLRFANRPYSTLLAKPCQRGWRPLTLTLSRKGRGDCYRGRLRFANRPYSTLLVPGPSETPSRVEPSHLAEARDAGLASANDATAPGSRYHNAPLTLAYEKGSNGHPPPSYGADGARSTDIADPSVRIDRFFALVQSYGRTPGVGRGLRRDPPKCERADISPAYPFLALVWRAPGWLRWSPITCRQWREAWTRYCRPCRSGSRRRGIWRA
ncbi:hypothetical protein D3C75_536940 [compost metagenome]